MYAIGDTIVKAKEIPDYCTPEFFDCLAKWQIAKVLGNPNGTIGWANEPSDFVEMFLALESEDSKWQQEQIERTKADTKAKSKGTRRSGHRR